MKPLAYLAAALLAWYALGQFDAGYGMFGAGNAQKVGPDVIQECHPPDAKRGNQPCAACHWQKPTMRRWANSEVHK